MRKLGKMILLLLAILLILGAGLYALKPHPPATPGQMKSVAELERYFNALAESGDPPGLSIVVVKDGKLVYNQAFGFADGPRGIPATPDTVYHWWSMTKIPTAIAILQLAEQDQLSLDDAVTDHLPWFEVSNPSGGGETITIRNLLQHTSGLPDTIPAMIGWVHYDDAGRDQTKVVRSHLAEFDTLKFTPGERAAYSNANYMLLGAVIQAITGQPYEDYIREHILDPLGMGETDFVVSNTMAAHEAAGTLPVVHFYTPLLPALLDPRTLIRERQGKLFWLNRVYIDATPSTGLIGPAPDVARLMLTFLNGGELEGVQLLSPASAALLTETLPVDGQGLGWFVGGTGDRRYLEHAGGGPGFATIMRIYSENNLGITILSNGTDLDRQGLVELLGGMAW